MAVSDYFGKICPYCKSVFTAADDIVVCSACDMPHHRDCWIENQVCTTFGCQGTIESADKAQTTVTATWLDYEAPTPVKPVYCTRCGTPNVRRTRFCGRCGSPMVIWGNQG